MGKKLKSEHVRISTQTAPKFLGVVLLGGMTWGRFVGVLVLWIDSLPCWIDLQNLWTDLGTFGSTQFEDVFAVQVCILGVSLRLECSFPTLSLSFALGLRNRIACFRKIRETATVPCQATTSLQPIAVPVILAVGQEKGYPKWNPGKWNPCGPLVVEF